LQSDPVLDQLLAMLSNHAAVAKLAPVLTRVESSLIANPEWPQAWEPLDLFNPVLPGSIESCWIFILRAGGVFGAERHPNSHQRTFALKGAALFEVFADGVWSPHPIDSAGSSAEGKAISIPPGIWHSIKIGPRNFISISFHTVPAHELIEETPVDQDLSVTRQRLYHA